MDGYIKNKNSELKEVRSGILLKCSPTLLLTALFTLLWLFCMNISSPPEEWKKDEIVFSHTEYERSVFFIIKGNSEKSLILNTADSEKYILPTREISPEQLSKELVQGKKYTIVYSVVKGGLINNHIEAISDENNVYLDLSESEKAWYDNQKDLRVYAIVTVASGLFLLIITDRLWCKKEHAQIKEIKAKIKKRNEKKEKIHSDID